QRGAEVDHGFSEDAGLTIEWPEVRQRLRFWEDFLAKNPKFPYATSIRWYVDVYAGTLLTGMDNSHITDENNKLRDEVKAVYRRFLAEDRASPRYELVKEYFAAIEKNGFVVGDQADAVLKRHHVEPMTGEPPRY